MCLKTSSKTFHMVPLRLLTLPQMSSPHISARLDFIPHCTHIHAHTCQKKNFVRIWQQRHRIRYNRQCHNGKVKRTVFGWEMHWQWWKWLDSDFKINHHEFSFVDRADVNFIDMNSTHFRSWNAFAPHCSYFGSRLECAWSENFCECARCSLLFRTTNLAQTLHNSPHLWRTL